MPAVAKLTTLLENSCRLYSGRTAVDDPDHGAVTYAQLQQAASQVGRALREAGVRPGDRVGLCAPKSVGVVAAIFGILSNDAAYVPVDATAPARRSAFIFSNCGVRALVVHRPLFARLQEELGRMNCRVLGSVEVPGAQGLDLLLVGCTPVEPEASGEAPRDLAYILYTSGSTGVPKGVMHSNASALSFVDWCSQEFQPTPDDRFSSHAPFHFDLSIFDLFASVKHGGALTLIGEECGKQPLQLASLIEERRLTIWYSTPSILRLLVEYGKLADRDCSALRLVLYAGEVFPPKHQHALRAVWPHPLYYNLYGPTETNVCTFDRVREVPRERAGSALPIGWVCSGDLARVSDPDGREVPTGEEGELYVTGGSVMLGYWNLPEQNARAFHADEAGRNWYKTGDVVIDEGGGFYVFQGRRDRMVKRRGYRVELAEIEGALNRHEHIDEAAVIALPDPESGVLIKAFVGWSGPGQASLIELKRFAAQNLPAYMVPDRFAVLRALPKTSTDKIDYQKLREQG
jgi:amino acid adenylation domain-containing protein